MTSAPGTHASGHTAWRAYEAEDAKLSGLDPVADNWYWEQAPDAERSRWDAAASAVAGPLRAELADTRNAFTELAARFTQGRQSGWTARISGTVLHRLCLQAKVPGPDGVVAAADEPEREITALRAAPAWWVCTGPLPGGKKILGPFITQELALTVRNYIVTAERRASLWIGEERQP